MPFRDIVEHSFKVECDAIKGGEGFFTFMPFDDEVKNKYWPDVYGSVYALPAVFEKFYHDNPSAKNWNMKPRGLREGDIEWWCEQNGFEHSSKSHTVYDYDELEIAEIVFSMRSEKCQYIEIANYLNGEGYLTHHGNYWTPENVRQWARDRK